MVPRWIYQRLLRQGMIQVGVSMGCVWKQNRIFASGILDFDAIVRPASGYDKNKSILIGH